MHALGMLSPVGRHVYLGAYHASALLDLMCCESIASSLQAAASGLAACAHSLIMTAADQAGRYHDHFPFPLICPTMHMQSS